MSEPVGIFIPAMRAARLGALVANIHEATPQPHHIYVMSNRVSCLRAVRGLDGVTAWRDRLRPWGHRLNALYRRTSERYFFCGADDVRFWSGWLSQAMRVMESVDGVVVPSDRLNQAGTLALVSRHYIDTESGCVDRPRTVIYPGYRHNFSESELFWTARKRHRFAYATESVVEHLHHLNAKRPFDEVDALGYEHWAEDEALFNSRRHLWDSL